MKALPDTALKKNKFLAVRRFTALCLFSISTTISYADVTPSSMFGNGMVLQREMPVPVWGKATPGEAVTVTFVRQSKSATADKMGNWIIKLDALKASAKGARLTIRGKNTITFTDVLVGEVWVCSGQSNMSMGYKGIPELQALVPDAKKRPIRHFSVPTYVAFEPQDNCKGKWSTQPSSSAVGFGFSYYLNKQLNIPVAVIQTAWGSSSIEGWMPLDMTKELPHFAQIMKNFETEDRAKVTALLKKGKWQRRENVYLRTRPNILYNAMMHPIIPFACRGIAWYQGEANGSNPKLYAKSLPAWVKRLRKQWGKADLHCLVVMLPRFKSKSWAKFREAQMGVLMLPHTGVANTIDLGELKNIHPKDKEPIGKRLALLAARDVNKKDVIAEGPRFKNIKIRGATLTVSFDHAEGLKTSDGNPPTHFLLAGKDKKWRKGTAIIKGRTVVITAAGLDKPVSVRYAFAAFPEVNLVNGAGLPAHPFRSDS